MQNTKEGSRPMVKLFSLLTCSHCREVKEFLTQKGVPFQLILVDLFTGEERSEALRELKSANPRCTFPTLLIGDVVVVGFKKDEIERALT